MRVRKTFLILYLATGLSAGLLSGCNPFSNTQTQPSPSPTETISQSVTDNQQTHAIENLKTLQQQLKTLQEKRRALNTLVGNIKVTEDGTKVENPVDYAQAKTIVDELANAYKTFKDSLTTEKIKDKINFDSFNSSIDSVLKNDSQERKILDDLAEGYKLSPRENTYNQKYNDAQTKLSQYTIGNQPIYQSDIDGEDGSRQRIATKKLLEQILNVTKPLATLKTDNLSEQPTLTTDELKTQLEQLKKDINRNNWVWPLFNTLALLAIAVIVFLSFFLVWNKISSILVTYQTKKSTDLGKDEQQILEHLQKIKSVLDGLGNKIIWLQIVPFNKKQVDSSELKNMVDTLKNLDDQFKELYSKIIISQSILVESDNDKQEEDTKVESDNDKQEEDTKAVYFQNWLEAQLQSIKKEIITDVKSTSLDETTQNTLKELSNKFSNIQEIVGSLSIGKEGGSISQHKEKVDQLEIKIKEHEDQKERHLTRIEELQNERNRLSQNLAEQRQQIEQLSSGEVEQLRQQKQGLYSSYQDLQQRLQTVNNEKVQLEQQATTLNSQVNQLQQDKEDLALKANENVEEIQKLKTEIDRLRKLLNKEAIETVDIPWQWQNIINSYNQSPDAILNIHGVHKQGEVVEDEDKGAERRNNSSKPVVLTSNMSPDGFYIVSVVNDYLLFPKQHAIAASQKFTVSALFDGYKSGNTSKFTLISPAQVTPVGSSGMWQLKHKGKLEYN